MSYSGNRSSRQEATSHVSGKIFGKLSRWSSEPKSSANPTSVTPREGKGLWEWPSEVKDESDMVDIIAVHGLYGDWERTWEKDGKVWLRDFLGHKIDKIRVLTFGYDSRIAFSRWTNQIESFAEQLLTRVRYYRDTEQQRSRPIIFLGHSLGGLIIKEALITAHARPSAWPSILDATKGVIFMGTPHYGADLAKWTSMLHALTRALAITADTDILGDLTPGSRKLAYLNSRFVERASGLYRIISFYEQRPVVKSLVVEPDSAILHKPNEIPIGLDESHVSMCKFAYEESQAFSAVWRPIREMVNSIRDLPLEASILAKANLRDMLAELSDTHSVDSRGASIPPLEGTCKWILQHQLFLEWRERSRSSLLWLTGSPGSGKSMLSDFIASHLEKESKLLQGFTVCSHSFSEKNLTPESFLRRMVYQTLKSNEDLRGSAAEFWSTGSAGSLRSWDSLWLFWTNICERVKGGHVFWVVDALDECTDIGKMKDFHNKVTALVTTLNNTTKSHLCCHVLLTGRPEACREICSRPRNRITLENEPAIDKDIKTLVNFKVQMLADSESLKEAEVDELKHRLLERADRTFIWVALALETFEDDLRREAYNETSWAKAVGKIALTLDGTYAKLWSQLDYGSPGNSRDLLRFVLAGNGSLTVSDLSVLLTLEGCNKTIGDVEREAQDACHFVQKSHGSFLRPVKRSDGLEQMRLVHETAKEHLIQTPRYSIAMKDCHLQLAKRCVKYLLLVGLDDVLDQLESQTVESTPWEHPLLRYSVLNWAYHLRESESEMNNKDFVEEALSLYRHNSIRYRSWSRAFWRLSSRAESKHDYTPLQMCTYNGHVRILEALLSHLGEADRKAKIDQRDITGNTALHYAAECGHAGAVNALLKAEADRNVRNKAGLTALHKAVECNEADVVTRLINGGINIDVRTTGWEPQRTALHLAAGAGLLKMVKLLVDHGANIQLYDSQSFTAADQAFNRGHGRIQQFLLTKEGGSVTTELGRTIMEGNATSIKRVIRLNECSDTTDSKGSTPLHTAARGGNEEVVRLVLKYTRVIDIQDDDGMTPLHVAARYGCREAVEVLLENGAKVDALSTDRSTPLHEAALGGSDSIIRRLLDAKAGPTSVDTWLRTPLLHASGLGYDQVVETLLANMQTKDMKDRNGYLPIHVAAMNGHTKVVERLLRENVRNVMATDQSGSTPLSLAACGKSPNHAETVKLLIENGADASHKRRDGAAPILLAASCGNEQSIRYLLGEKIINLPPKAVDPDERDLSRSTPLSLAAAGGYEDCVLLLLRYGAKDVTQRVGQDRRDPISWAAGHGMVEAVKELLKVPGLVLDSCDDHFRTPLSHAAANGHAGVVSQLLGHNNASASQAAVDFFDDIIRTPLSWAAAAGHKDVVELLLIHQADPTIKSAVEGGAPISCAAIEGHNEILSLFLQRKEELPDTIHDSLGRGLLSLAAAHGRTSTVEYLLGQLQSSEEINETSKLGYTPLMLAVQQGHEAAAQLLVSHGANVHSTAPNGLTSLLLSIEQGSWANVDMLIKHDSKVLEAATENGETPLHLAVSEGSYAIVKLLFEIEHDVATRTPHTGDTLLHLAVKRADAVLLSLVLEHAGHFINDQNADGMTPLLIAAANWDEDSFDCLLSYSLSQKIPLTSLFIRDRQQNSLLMTAARGGNCSIVQKILGLVADRTDEIRHTNRLRWSPLTVASNGNNGEVVRLILSHTLEGINECDPHPELGRSPLLWAAHFGDEETVEYLLSQSTVDQYRTDRNGYSSLWLATSQGHTSVVQLLLKAPTTNRQMRTSWLNIKDISKEESALHEAAHLGYMDIVNMLLSEEDLDINCRNAYRESAFSLAIIYNQELLVKLLAEDSRVNTTIRDIDGRSALTQACRKGHVRIVRYLLAERRRLKIDVDAVDNRGKSALFHTASAKRGDSKIVQLLLDANASSDGREQIYSRTPLILASRAGNFQIVKLLCDRKDIDIDAKDSWGYTALTTAAHHNKSNIVRFLLARGADPNTRYAPLNRTPLMEAARKGYEATVRELLPKSDLACEDDDHRTATWFIMNSNRDRQKASFEDLIFQSFQDTSSNKVLDAFRRQFDDTMGVLQLSEMFMEFHVNSINVNEVDINGHTPLMLLIGKDDALSVRRLLDLGADLKYQSSTGGWSAFHEAASKGSYRALGELLDFANGDAIFDALDFNHATALSYAAGKPSVYAHVKFQMNFYLIVRMLLEQGAYVNVTTLDQGRTPLMYAAHLGWDKVVGLLLKHGADVSIQDTEYDTALSLAVRSGSIATVRRLLDANALYRIKDKSGATPLIVAAFHGHLALVRLFFEKYHLSMQDKDRSGRTALSYAASGNYRTIVQYLLRNRPDPDVDMLDIQDRQDQTALTWTCKSGNWGVLRILIERGADFRRRDRNKRMPLSHAAEGGFTYAVKILLEAEEPEQLPSILNWQDSAGRTALSWAAEEGRTDVVRELLAWGADPSLADSRKQTPRMWALDKGHTQLTSLLDAHEDPASDEETDDAGSDMFFSCELIPPT